MKPSLPEQAYNQLADAYASMTDTKPHNAYYERPATRRLVGDVSGQSVLDAGCGSGANCEWLLDQGAAVVGVDANDRMLAHAREKLGQRANLQLANLEEPLAFFEDESFDGVLSSLAITYVEDHARLFAEFNRILHPGGWFVFSTEHPFFSYRYFAIDNYFTTKEVHAEWTGFGRTVDMPSYFHSLGTITGALSSGGFLIEHIVEPLPTEDFKAADPAEYARLMDFPSFICFRAMKVS